MRLRLKRTEIKAFQDGDRIFLRTEESGRWYEVSGQDVIAVDGGGQHRHLVDQYKLLQQLESGSMKEVVRDATMQIERDLIRKALDENGGNKKSAAKALKVSVATLDKKIKELRP